MKGRIVEAKQLTRKSFSKFGDILETNGRESFSINNGRCQRFNKLSELDLDSRKGIAAISIFRSNHCSLPVKLNLLERHPFGSQAFMPLHKDTYLVIVASDINGKPSYPKAFLTNGFQGVNFKKNIWHGVLTPIIKPCDFLVIDLSDSAENLEEFPLTEEVVIKAAV